MTILQQIKLQELALRILLNQEPEPVAESNTDYHQPQGERI